MRGNGSRGGRTNDRHEDRLRSRIEQAHRYFREHHAGVEPDASFADRVVARLPRHQPAEVLGWAAARLLPATVAVLLVLAWFAYRAEPVTTTAEAVTSPVDDLISWVLETPEEAP